jgi:hypothetical protein
VEEEKEEEYTRPVLGWMYVRVLAWQVWSGCCCANVALSMVSMLWDEQAERLTMRKAKETLLGGVGGSWQAPHQSLVIEISESRPD